MSMSGLKVSSFWADFILKKLSLTEKFQFMQDLSEQLKRAESELEWVGSRSSVRIFQSSVLPAPSSQPAVKMLTEQSPPLPSIAAERRVQWQCK